LQYCYPRSIPPHGWKYRDWFLGIDHRTVFDRAGNIGPAVWWNGEIIGSWAVTAAGEIRTRLLADRGSSRYRSH
jgi:hypothetical protein